MSKRKMQWIGAVVGVSVAAFSLSGCASLGETLGNDDSSLLRAQQTLLLSGMNYGVDFSYKVARGETSQDELASHMDGIMETYGPNDAAFYNTGFIQGVECFLTQMQNRVDVNTLDTNDLEAGRIPDLNLEIFDGYLAEAVQVCTAEAPSVATHRVLIPNR